MPPWLVLLGSGIAGIVVGAAILSLLTVLFFLVFFREALNDGQFAMVFMLTVPVGGMLGAGASAALIWWWLGGPLLPWWAWLAEGTLLLLLAFLFTWGGWPGRWEPPWFWL